jgi:hypothetical protein
MLARPVPLATLLLWMAVSARADPAASRPCELSRADRTHTPSSRCLSCHDGTAAPGLGESHPVDVDYTRASLRDPWRGAPAIAKLGAYVMALSALPGASRVLLPPRTVALVRAWNSRALRSDALRSPARIARRSRPLLPPDYRSRRCACHPQIQCLAGESETRTAARSDGARQRALPGRTTSLRRAGPSVTRSSQSRAGESGLRVRLPSHAGSARGWWQGADRMVAGSSRASRTGDWLCALPVERLPTDRPERRSGIPLPVDRAYTGHPWVSGAPST